MRIRPKLLILLLMIGLLPVVLVIWYDLASARQLGVEMSGQARELLAHHAATRLGESVRAAIELLRRDKFLLEAEARLQAREVERALATPVPVGTPVWVPNGHGAPEGLPFSKTHGGLPVSYDRFAAAIAPDATLSAVGSLPRLTTLVPLLRNVPKDFPRPVLWHHVAIKGGVHAVFPGRATKITGELRELPWYVRSLSKGDGEPNWTLTVDPATGWPTVVVSAWLWSLGGSFLGITAIEVPLAEFLDVPLEGEGTALLVKPHLSPDGTPSAMEILAEHLPEGGVASGLLLPADAVSGLSAVLEDMAAHRSNVRRMWFNGADSLLAYGGIDGFDAHLVYVAPYRGVVVDAAAASDNLLQRLANQRLALLIGLVFFVPGIVIVAVVASRAVTRPVRQLAVMARRLAGGDFAARANIRSGDEFEELGQVFDSMVPQLDESIRMRESLSLAMEVQQNLLPQTPPRIAGLDIAGLSIYCDETGGDYYDFIELPDRGPGAVAVAVGDVAGHGISAALLMTTARALLRSRNPEPGNLAGLMGDINRHLVADSHAGRFMTLFLAVLDAERRQVHWVSAGHDPAIIYQPGSGSFQDMAGLDIPLGVAPEWEYHELFHSGWSEGTILVIGTDGIWETRNPEGEMFGKDAIRSLIRDHAGLSAEQLASKVTDALAAFRGPRNQRDDVTLVVVKAV